MATRRRVRHWLITCLSLLWLGGLAVPAARAEPTPNDEALLKTAFLYNFAKFTRWPDGLLDTGAPFTLCYSGQDDVVDALAQLSGKPVKNHPIVVHEIPANGAAAECRILYVAQSETTRFSERLAQVHSAATLSISPLTGFAPAGGSVELYRENQRIRFIVNLGAVRRAGLLISPNLLKLAKVIGQD